MDAIDALKNAFEQFPWDRAHDFILDDEVDLEECLLRVEDTIRQGDWAEEFRYALCAHQDGFLIHCWQWLGLCWMYSDFEDVLPEAERHIGHLVGLMGEAMMKEPAAEMRRKYVHRRMRRERAQAYEVEQLERMFGEKP